jgi:hypothetical protein
MALLIIYRTVLGSSMRWLAGAAHLHCMHVFIRWNNSISLVHRLNKLCLYSFGVHAECIYLGVELMYIYTVTVRDKANTMPQAVMFCGKLA